MEDYKKIIDKGNKLANLLGVKYPILISYEREYDDDDDETIIVMHFLNEIDRSSILYE